MGNYQKDGKNYTRSILKTTLPDTTTEPLHSLQKPWEAPFFYSDSRHAFYVTTIAKEFSILNFEYFGFQDILATPKISEIPPLVFEAPPKVFKIPNIWDDDRTTFTNPGFIDPVPVQRFITEDAYLSQALGTTGSVLYGERNIGPSGLILQLSDLEGNL